MKTNDPNAQGDKAKKDERIRKQLDDDFLSLLGQIEFRRFLWVHMNADCDLFTDPFSTNGAVMNLNVGKQTIGKQLWSRIEMVDPKIIPQMMLEYFEMQDKA